MKREVKFSLVFRDMWQSAGKYVPRVDQLVKVAPAIIEMGCFARVETNGRYSNPHARPRTERTPYEPRSGRRPQIILQSKESTRNRHYPYVLRIERRA